VEDGHEKRHCFSIKAAMLFRYRDCIDGHIPPNRYSHDPGTVSLPIGEIDHLHYHNCCEFGVCREGQGLFIINDSFESVSVGDVVFIPPGSEHYSKSIHADKCCRFRFLYFDPMLVESALVDCSELSARLAAAKPAVMRGETPAAMTIRRMIANFTGGDMVPDELSAVMAAEMLLFHTERRIINEKKRDNVIIEAAAYIKLYYAEELRVDELARMFHLSDSRFRVRFRNEFGMTPHEYLSHIRGEIGAELLMRTDLTVAEIALNVGFSYPSEFYRCFFHLFGCSPSQFRERSRSELH